jgi:hypothetical protein
MLGISGVGQTRLDRYGDRFLSILRDEPEPGIAPNIDSLDQAKSEYKQ